MNYRERATQAAAYRLGKEFAKRLSVLLIRTKPHRTRKVEGPVGPDRYVSTGRGHAMGGREPEDFLVRGDDLIFYSRSQVVSYPHLVEPARYLRHAKERFYLGGEDERAAGPMVIERLDPRVVPGSEQRLSPPVPDGKWKVT